MLGLMVSSGGFACRLMSVIWLLPGSTRVAQLAAKKTLDRLEKTLIVLTATSAIDILLERSLHALVGKLWLLVLRVRLLSDSELLERILWLLVLEPTFGTLESSNHLVISSSLRMLQRFPCFSICRHE